MDRDKGKKPRKPTASQADSPSPRSAASQLGASNPEEGEEPTALPKRKAFESDHPILSFAGFSKDSAHFVYAFREQKEGAIPFLWITEPGIGGAKPRMSIDPEYLDSLREAEHFLKDGGYETTRTKPPEGLQMKAELGASPPVATLTLGKKSTRGEIGQTPYPEHFVVMIWGLSPDQKSIALAIGEPPANSPQRNGNQVFGAIPPRRAVYRIVKLPE